MPETDLIGMPLPALDLRGLHGANPPDLRTFKGRPFLLLLYTIGCPGCKARALPYANTVVQEAGGPSVLGIHTRMDGPVYSDDQIMELSKVYGLQFPVCADENGRAFRVLHGEGTPHWILCDRNGVIRKSIFGSGSNVLQRLDLALAELG